VLTFGFRHTPERLGQPHFYPNNRRTCSAAPRHNRRRSLLAFAAGPNVEGHSGQDLSAAAAGVSSPAGVGAETRTAAAPETLRAAGIGVISATVKVSYSGPTYDSRECGFVSLMRPKVAQSTKSEITAKSPVRGTVRGLEQKNTRNSRPQNA